jgi:hypothetical protein
MRILCVAAFAVSGYASSDGRPCKPFNPLLGETYEADYPENGIRFFSEKVSCRQQTVAISLSVLLQTMPRIIMNSLLGTRLAIIQWSWPVIVKEEVGDSGERAM